MFSHYFKVASRNLLKHKTQSVISLLSLAMAFASVSLALFWNHYELTYDANQSNADRIYRIRYTDNLTAEKRVVSTTPKPLAEYLQNKYPEVERACTIQEKTWEAGEFTNVLGLPQEMCMVDVSDNMPKIFDVLWKEGNKNIASWNENQIAVSEQIAKRIGEGESSIGKRLTTEYGQEFEIVAVYKDWSEHSNFKVDFIRRMKMDNSWGDFYCHTYVLLRENVDEDYFVQKMKSDTLAFSVVYDVVTPLKAIHYTYPVKERNIRLDDVHLFTVASILLSLCALLNYLVLFLNRLRNRGRDMALRTICGSSGWQMAKLLLTEYLLLLLASLLLSFVFIEISLNGFIELSMIEMSRLSVYRACGYLLLFIVALALLLSLIPIYYFKQKTLRVQIEAVYPRLGRSYFRQMGVCMQLLISSFFLFCTTVMMKQVYFLIHSDINIERERIAWVIGDNKTLNVLKQIPSVIEVIHTAHPLFPKAENLSNVFGSVIDWDGKAAAQSSVSCEEMSVSDEISRFYGLKIKEGIHSFNLGKNEIFVNEALARCLNMDDPLGKILVFKNGTKKRVVGVICDYHFQSPTEPVKPLYFVGADPNSAFCCAFKYIGDFATNKKIIEDKLGQEFTDRLMKDSEQTYRKYLKSEYNLLKLLSVITIISLLIALFGIYAMMVQACEKHRKEIAIRRVNGAQVLNILWMFFKQYMLQVVVACVIAFPVGYVLMKRWLEGYTIQTNISFWIFAFIFLGTLLLVTLCVGWHVWRAASENPAQVIRKE